jgi:Flp pilus assembly protein TadG
LVWDRLCDERGVAVVEFALVLPVLLLVLLGTIDFGKAINYWIDETHMANQAARLAAVNAPSSSTGGLSIQQFVQQGADTSELRNGGTAAVPNRTTVCISFPNGTSNVGDPVMVNVSIPSYNWMPFLASSTYGTGLTSQSITASATMRLEATPTNYSAGCF